MLEQPIAVSSAEQCSSLYQSQDSSYNRSDSRLAAVIPEKTAYTSRQEGNETILLITYMFMSIYLT